MVGAFAFPAAIPTIADLMLPLFMCVVEFALFMILINQVTSLINLNSLINIWLILMAIFSGVALLSIARAQAHFKAATRVTTEEGIYSEDAREIINRYVKYLLRDEIGAGITCAASVISAALRIAGATAEPLDFLLPLFIIALLASGLRGHGQTARMWRLHLSSKEAKLPIGELPLTVHD